MQGSKTKCWHKSAFSELPAPAAVDVVVAHTAGVVAAVAHVASQSAVAANAKHFSNFSFSFFSS